MLVSELGRDLLYALRNQPKTLFVIMEYEIFKKGSKSFPFYILNRQMSSSFFLLKNVILECYFIQKIRMGINTWREQLKCTFERRSLTGIGYFRP